MINYVDFYKDNIDILNLEIRFWIKNPYKLLQKQLKHIIRTYFNIDIKRYIIEYLNFDWREIYHQPPSGWYNFEKLEKEILEYSKNKDYFPTFKEINKNLKIGKKIFDKFGGYTYMKDYIIKKYNLYENFKLNEGYKNTFIKEKFDLDVSNEIKKYSKYKSQNYKTENFNILEAVSYKKFNKSLTKYAIENLNIDWSEICLNPPSWYYDDYDKLKKDLLDVCNILGKFPSVLECSEYLNISYMCFEKHGGYMNVRANINYNEKLLDKSGYINKSNGEFIISNFLFDNDIRFNRDVIISPNSNIDGKYNCDFVIKDIYNNKYWIEYWGLEGSSLTNYDEIKEYKKSLYKNYNLNLIEIHLKDFVNNTHEDFIKILEKKILNKINFGGDLI
jgi:hypothetical protein